MEILKKRDLDILQYIIENNDVKQAEISEILGIDRGNLSRRCNDFKESGILKDGYGLEFNNKYQSYLILEIEHSKGRCFTTDIFGIITSDVIELKYNTEKELQSLIYKTIKQFDDNTFDAIGCVVHAKIVDRKIKHLTDSPLADFDICGFIATFNTKPIYIENFANLAALSHYIYEYPDKHSLFYLRTLAGVGAGLIYHNKIFHGFSGSAMEPAWLLMNSEFEQDKFMQLFYDSNSSFWNDNNVLENDNLEDYIRVLNYIINNIKAIIDPELFILDSKIFADNEHLLYMLDQKNIHLSRIEHNQCYKSICKIMLQAETGINYTRIKKDC